MQLSYTEENYLKAVLKLSGAKGSNVSTNEIAEELETKASSVTDMIRRLSEKGMCHYVKYQGTRLTDEGRVVAISVVRKHRLWEVFLVNKLQFSWDEVHDVAEQLEHIKSKQLMERLYDFLGEPKFDPHGNPIPDLNGNFPERSSEQLITMEADTSCVVLGVTQDNPDFLKYLNKIEVKLGVVITVLDHNDFDGSMDLMVNNEKVHISAEVGKSIMVKQQEKKEDQ